MFRKYLPIFLLTFVNVIGFTILIPVLPEVSNQYIPSEYNGIAYGALLSSYALFQFLAAPILGSLSDKYGRKPILLISQLGTTLSWVIFGAAYFIPQNMQISGLSLSFIVIAISRITDGITGGNISVAQAWASDVTPNEQKTQVFGLFGAVFGIGFLFGPAIGGLSFSTQLGYLGTAILAFLISAFTLVFMYFRLPESLTEETKDKQLHIRFWKEINFWLQIKPFRKNKLIMNLMSLRFFFALVFASYTTVVVLLIEQDYNLSPAGLGFLLTIIGIYSIFNQGFLVGKISKRIGDLNTIFFSIAMLIIGLVTLPFIPSSLMVTNPITSMFGPETFNLSLLILMVNAYLLNAGISLGQPSFKSIFTKNVPATKQGKITGLDESLLAFGQGVSPVIAGGLFSVLGIYVFYVYAVLMIVPTVFTYLRLKR